MCTIPALAASTAPDPISRQSPKLDPSPAVKKRIEDGEAADVVIVQPDFAEDLTKSGKVSAGDRPIIGHVGIGLGNRKDSLAYDISTVEKLKNTLLGANLLVFNSVKSGEAFAMALERLGIAETLKPKNNRATPNGIFEPVLKCKGNDMIWQRVRCRSSQRHPAPSCLAHCPVTCRRPEERLMVWTAPPGTAVPD